MTLKETIIEKKYRIRYKIVEKVAEELQKLDQKEFIGSEHRKPPQDFSNNFNFNQTEKQINDRMKEKRDYLLAKKIEKEQINKFFGQRRRYLNKKIC